MDCIDIHTHIVPERFPDYAGKGRDVPWPAMLLPRLVHAWNALPKAKQSLAESPAIYARRFFYDALVFEPKATRFVIDSFGSSHVCLGGDYPFNMGDSDPLGTLERSGLDAGVIAAISSANARRFLGL